MTDIVLAKASNGTLIPVDPQAQEFISKLKLGAGVTASVKLNRNPKFHRKYFALLNFAFDAWEPVTKEYKGQKVCKQFDQFRRDIVILAGYYDTSITLKGDVRLTAKSISFSRMSEDEFSSLYDATIGVILSRILTNYTKDDIERVIDQLLIGFA